MGAVSLEYFWPCARVLRASRVSSVASGSQRVDWQPAHSLVELLVMVVRGDLCIFATSTVRFSAFLFFGLTEPWQCRTLRWRLCRACFSSRQVSSPFVPERSTLWCRVNPSTHTYVCRLDCRDDTFFWRGVQLALTAVPTHNILFLCAHLVLLLLRPSWDGIELLHPFAEHYYCTTCHVMYDPKSVRSLCVVYGCLPRTAFGAVAPKISRDCAGEKILPVLLPTFS